MTLKAKIYLLFVYSAGIALLYNAFSSVQTADIWVILLWFIIATPLEIRPIQASADLQYTLSFIIHLTIIVIYGFWDAIIVAALVTTVTDLLGRKGIVKLFFNISQFAISIYCAGTFFIFFKRTDLLLTLPDDIFAFIGAGTAYILANLFLVSAIVAFTLRQSLFSVIKTDFKVIILNYLALAPISMLMVLLYKDHPLTMIIIAPLLIIADSSFRSYISLKVETKNTLEILADFVDKRDHYTAEHSKRVTEYACMIADKLAIDEDTYKIIEMAGRVHDLGKIGIRDDILLKPGYLTNEEMEVMKTHPDIGYKILEPLNMYKKGSVLVREHHERYDGSGYPRGLMGKEINIGSRILSVADTYDAMTTDRPYRKALTKDEAVAELKKHSGGQFDPEVVEAFLIAMDSQ